MIQIYGQGKIAHDDKSWRKWKALLVIIISLLIGLWFYYKLGMVSIHIPFNGDLYLGILIIPFFIIVALATFSGGVIDGLDGLSGGVLASIFAAYSMIAFANNQIDIAAFSGVVTGAILAFFWFNIPPARFYMGETGIIGLTITLATLAFLTDSVLILPIVAMPLVVSFWFSSFTNGFKKLRKRKKLFRLAPIHHHFEALGWPSYKVTMRFGFFGCFFCHRNNFSSHKSIMPMNMKKKVDKFFVTFVSSFDCLSERLCLFPPLLGILAKNETTFLFSTF